MRVGMVSTFAAKCGIATYTKYLCEALASIPSTDSNVFPYVMAEFPYPDLKAYEKFDTMIPYKPIWTRGKPMDTVISGAKDFDIVHVQHQFGLFPISSINDTLYDSIKVPIVTTLHDVVPYDPNFADYMKPFLQKSSKIIVHTQTCYDLLTQWGTINKTLIPHGTVLIPDTPKKEARKAVGLPENATIILSWGFIWESKGILDLVKILAEVKKVIPNAVLVHAGGIHPMIAGSDYLRSILRTAIQLKLSPKDLIVTQWVPEEKVPMYLSSADVIVLNYMRGSASASGAAHRAMAAHRPIVKTDDQCIMEIPGYTVPRFNTTALKGAIENVLQHPLLQEELVEKAEKAALEMSWDAVAKQHKTLYESI